MNVPKALMQAYEQLGLEYDLMHISFFISRDRIVHSVGDGMSPWRENYLFRCSVIPVR